MSERGRKKEVMAKLLILEGIWLWYVLVILAVSCGGEAEENVTEIKRSKN